ncbi:FixH family protein [Planomicrobium sp. YIM 101495]|uniref:FixH family protein n=1 Tax=Planomicrobium sp. YIM 101495 TaxID=2665160 RepID=UPI0012B9037D|nr:FixH family protein [Planomicrobium sp. YIM 101495]MTD31647.1 hypothetical protein [Planomicrobium sp. YIM 101495]
MKKMMFLTIMILFLAACGSDSDSAGAGDMVVEVEVDIQTPEQAEPGDTVALIAEVTQGGEAVEDADEVVYEVWQSGHRDHGEMIEASHSEDGLYEAEKLFEEEGLYFIQAHTTARSMHVMPKQEITVGDPDPDSIEPDDTDDADSMMDMEDHSGH